jgi:hypothetical protein
MRMSKNFQKVKDYYDHGKWSLVRVQNAVGKWITEEEYELIVNPVAQNDSETATE